VLALLALWVRQLVRRRPDVVAAPAVSEDRREPESASRPG
jgi:hypothetical protein